MNSTTRFARTSGTRRSQMKWGLLAGSVLLFGLSSFVRVRAETPIVTSPRLTVQFDASSGLPSQMETKAGRTPRNWLHGPVQLSVRNEVTSAVANWGPIPATAWQRRESSCISRSQLEGLPLEVHQEWSSTPDAVAPDAVTWSLDFRGDGARVAHEVTIDLPIISETLRVFTPTERGVMEIASRPDFQGLPYAAIGWDTGQSWVLPLVSVMDPQSDEAVTIALPADANIPHLQFSWHAGQTLRITLGHRGMGGSASSPLKLLFFAHAADYRASLGAYVSAFPQYFRPPLPRGPFEGTFWYHHIQDQPDPDEAARQHVRYIWSSFWFSYLGEYLPDAAEWEPYTFAKWWKLGETMNDQKIRDFVQSLHARGIGTYAYFNVTEFGGAGGKTGDTAEAAKTLREQFADALIKDAKGNDIPTWEGAMAMNPGSRYTLWPQLDDQVRRHLTRLPELDGFVIDRLDWASLIDYGHGDGLSMVGEQPVENMALPVGEAVRHVAELSHAAGKRVFVNQFYRVEVLRDVDGVCHENDYLPALGYLTPLRPASAWHHRKPYAGDLLAFESQLKLRLQWALFPQMIAHQFPISQQAPDPRAADFLELYAPLFDTLLGKEQVLMPHCVTVTGNNDVNLFVNPHGHYIVPITSRTRFLSRKDNITEPITATLRVPNARQITWARAISADGESYPVEVVAGDQEVQLKSKRHGTATVLEAGSGQRPGLIRTDRARGNEIRSALITSSLPAVELTGRPEAISAGPLRWRLTGSHVGSPGPVQIHIGDTPVGQVAEHESHASGDWTPTGALEQPPRLSLSTSEEGTWFVPERLEILATRPDGSSQRLAVWQANMAIGSESTRNRIILPTAWSLTDIPKSTAEWVAQDPDVRGHWKDRFGARGVWLAGLNQGVANASGYQVDVLSGTVFHWPAPAAEDVRVPDHPQNGAPQPTCWFANDRLRLRITAPTAEPYRLSLYVMDFDRNGRAAHVTLSDEFAPLAATDVSAADAANGVYLTWTVRGNVYVALEKTAGFNVVLSGVFIDP